MKNLCRKFDGGSNNGRLFRQGCVAGRLLVSQCHTLGRLIALMMEAVRAFETSVNFYETTLSNIRGGCHVHTRRHENLKSHLGFRLLRTSTYEVLKAVGHLMGGMIK
jgi:hypothetical protein